MGNNVSNNFNFGTLFRNWTKYCMSCSAIPFMAQTLMQVGPPGWMLNNFATSVWPSTNMGPVGDWLQVGNSKNGSATKFNQLESILKDYAATLNDAEKTVLENKLKEFEDLKSSEKTQEKYEELLEIYDDYKGKIKESKLTDKGLGKADLKALENLTLENIQALVPDNDVADIVNAWNSNSNTKGTNLVATLQEKIKNGTETEKASAKAVLDKLYEKLKNKAILFEDDTNLSDKSNKALEKAIDDFDAFDSSRYTSAEYVKAFDNLYMATRLAEAEIAQKELKEEFKFLGEDSPFAEADFVSETQRDLRTEGLRKAQTVEVPENDPEIETPKEQTPPAAKINLGANNTGGADINIEEENADSQTPKRPEQETAEHKINNEHYENAVKQGEKLVSQVAGPSIRSKTESMLEKINRDNVVGIIDGFNAKVANFKNRYKDHGIIEWLARDEISGDKCNEIVKKLMYKAIDVGLNPKNCPEFEKLSKHFDAEYKNKIINFRRETEAWYKSKYNDIRSKRGYHYKPYKAEELDKMINALVKAIKEKEGIT